MSADPAPRQDGEGAALCQVWYDGDRPGPQTHTCLLHDGHDGLHQCPICDQRWHKATCECRA